jgi:CHAT domain-containing protein
MLIWTTQIVPLWFFAPEPSGREDGLLQVREIRGLHLKTKLVTLSACNTGVGPVGEAGVANLVNAFIEAGADSVVSTLWELEDHATEHLMAVFYSQLARHTRKVDALRTAQLDLLNQGLPPYFWASFQIVGDPDGTLWYLDAVSAFVRSDVLLPGGLDL